MQNSRVPFIGKKINLLPKKESKSALRLVFDSIHKIGILGVIYQSDIFPFYRNNDPIRQYDVGYNYETSKNYSKAVKWYNLAAKQSHVKAMYRLGILYEAGLGIVKNYPNAIKWYYLAALHHHTDAQYRLACLYEEHSDTPKDDEQALKWYKIAAEQGHHKAIIKIMSMYKNGKISLPNNVDAYVWLCYSVAVGMPGAEDECDSLAQKLSPIQLNHAKMRVIHLYESRNVW